MFGTVLENVVIDPATRRSDFDADRITENTRASYPIHYIPNHLPSGAGGHPRNIVFLTADAFGVMPPDRPAHRRPGDVPLPVGLHRQGRGHRARRDRAVGHVLRLLRRAVPAAAPGRVCRDAGREDRAARVKVWLVNTGWTGGPYGTGSRMKLPAHPGDGARGALRGARRAQVRPRSGLWLRGAARGARGAGRAAHPARAPGPTGRLRRPGAEAGRHVPGEFRAVPLRRCPKRRRPRDRGRADRQADGR